MDLDHIESLQDTLRQLSHEEQDHLASFLLMERLKRNQLIMPVVHQRIEDANPDNWTSWEKTKPSLENN